MVSLHPKKYAGRFLHEITLAAAGAALFLAGCSGDDGSTGPAGPPGPPGSGGGTSDVLSPGEPSPGLELEIVELTGGTGAGGRFQVGDRITIVFTAKKSNGTDWDLSELTLGRTLVSGPTFNYQRIIPEKSNLVTAAVPLGGGRHSYTFAEPIPAVYLPPLNDSDSFGPLDGELQGQPLLSGTYTVGAYVGWGYSVGSKTYRDIGDATRDFLLGDATTLTPRQVVGLDNCNQCHESLRMHGGNRRNVDICLLCHTAGAEDKNVASVEGGTPGVSIEFKVMIHKIHAGAHLPSVLGVATNADGTRDYDATPKPYKLVGFNNSVHDYSDVGFPVWPNLNIPMPRDGGYSALTTEARALEDQMRRGPTSCFVCHGDPDGDGPLTAPTHGSLAYEQPTRGACGSCHDDIDWSHPYTANNMTMPPQADDSACKLCHAPSGGPLAVLDAHRHPLLDPAFNPGLNFEVLSVEESGSHDGDGTIDPGEKVKVTFRITNDAGDVVAPSALGSMSLAISGPMWNSHLLTTSSFPTAALQGPQPFETHLPERVWLEYVGTATVGQDVFTTVRFPHWSVSGAATEVRAGTLAPASGDSVLAAASVDCQNYLDVVDATGFDRNGYVVIARGVPGQEEYLRIQSVEGNRLWFGAPNMSTYAPGPARAHAAGTTVQGVTLPVVPSSAYTLDAATGTITETGDFGTGNAVVVTYTSDFVMPTHYPMSINETPARDETDGKWTGKALVPGTYSLAFWGQLNLTLTAHGESNSYRGTSPGRRTEFLVGGAATLEPYDRIAAESCNACHQDIYFHGGGRRGFDTCIMCHGTAGAEDRPRYVAPGAPDTKVAIEFREMLHKIHRGKDLANASSYKIVGYSTGAYPNNFGLSSFEHVAFPAMPGGVMQCAKCHGDADGWQLPPSRNHPTEQGKPVRVWGMACGSCHDSDAAQGHIEIMTAPSGLESCSVCHGASDDLRVPYVHEVR